MLNCKCFTAKTEPNFTNPLWLSYAASVLQDGFVGALPCRETKERYANGLWCLLHNCFLANVNQSIFWNLIRLFLCLIQSFGNFSKTDWYLKTTCQQVWVLSHKLKTRLKTCDNIKHGYHDENKTPPKTDHRTHQTTKFTGVCNNSIKTLMI